MARKKKKKKSGSSPRVGSVFFETGGDRIEDIIELPLDEAGPLLKEMCAAGRQKKALDTAKTLHAAHQNPESENLLAECYLERIKGFLAKNMVQEARGLMDLVHDRFPRFRDRLTAYRLKIDVKTGQLHSLLSPLNDPDLPEKERRIIEFRIGETVTDLSLIADCDALPPDHALRRAAADLWTAFQAVCSGPVDDEQIALRSVSRKSPLASWKMLVWAIAAFYRRDDQSCRQFLNGINPDMAPAQLVPVFLSNWGDIDLDSLPKGSRVLAGRIGGFPDALYRYLTNVENMAGQGHRNLPSAIKKAVAECRRIEPAMLDRLKQRIFTYCFTVGEPLQRVYNAIGEAPVKNATFWQEITAVYRRDHSPLHALAAWEEFRLHAINEKLFGPGSVEESVLYQTMARLCFFARSEMETYEDERDFLEAHYHDNFTDYSDQPPAVRDAVTMDRRDPDPLYFLDPDKIFERSCQGENPDQAYSLWLETAKQYHGVRKIDQIAEQWHQACPHNIKPLLHLAETAERKKALKKALNLVEEAERLDELNPAVRRMRLRLIMSNARVHIGQRKPHLLTRDIQALESLPMIREGDRPALVSGLRWALSLIEFKKDDARAHYEAMVDFFQSRPTAWLLGHAFSLFTSRALDAKMPPIKEWSANGIMIEAVSRILMLTDEAGMDITLPYKVHTHLTKLLAKKNPSGTALQFRIVAEAALEHSLLDLAYAASGAGLALGGLTEAAFLYLRAQSMIPYPAIRKKKCLAITIHLAKKQGDQELLARAMETLRETGVYWDQQAIVREAPSQKEMEYVLWLEKKISDPENQGMAAVEYEQFFGKFSHYHTGDPQDAVDPDDFDHDLDDDVFDDDDDDMGDSWDILNDLIDHNEPDQQYLFPDPTGQALQDVLKKITQAFPNHRKFPSPEELMIKNPALATELAQAIEDLLHEHGDVLDQSDLFEALVGRDRKPKRSPKQSSRSTKARKKRKRR